MTAQDWRMIVIQSIFILECVDVDNSAELKVITTCKKANASEFEGQFDERSDVTIKCEPFVENADSVCQCALNVSQMKEGAGKCSSTVGYVTLKLLLKNGQKSECEYLDYNNDKAVINRKQSGYPAAKNTKPIRCENHVEEREGRVGRLRVLKMVLHGEQSLHNNSDFCCSPNCLGGKLTCTAVDIPVVFSEDCAPGFYGDLCNFACSEKCEGGDCKRVDGTCTFKKDEKKIVNTVAVAVGVGVTAAAVGSCLYYCDGFKMCCDFLIEQAGCGESESEEESDEEYKMLAAAYLASKGAGAAAAGVGGAQPGVAGAATNTGAAPKAKKKKKRRWKRKDKEKNKDKKKDKDKDKKKGRATAKAETARTSMAAPLVSLFQADETKTKDAQKGSLSAMEKGATDEDDSCASTSFDSSFDSTSIASTGTGESGDTLSLRSTVPWIGIEASLAKSTTVI